MPLKTTQVWTLTFSFLIVSFLLTSAYAISVNEYPIPTANSSPFQIMAGVDGHLWFTESTGGKIARIFVDGKVTEYLLPNPLDRAEWLTTTVDSSIWFTLSSAGGNKLGRMSLGGTFTEFKLPNPGDSPYALTGGRVGQIWYVVGGKKIGQVSPGGMITEYVLPVGNFNAITETTTALEGTLYFLQLRTQNSPQPAEYFLGKMTPLGNFSETAIGNTNLYTITDLGIASDGSLWCSTINAAGTTTQNGLRRFNANGTLSDTFIATGKLAPLRFVMRRDGSFWFLATNGAAHTLGSATVDGKVTEYATGGTPRFTNLAVGVDDNLWFTEPARNSIYKLTPDRPNGFSVTRGSSYVSGAVAPESIATIFGSALAGNTDSATSVPLPLSLAATSVKIRDSGGVEHTAPLFYVSPTQINFLVPALVTLGNATVTITDAANSRITLGTMVISAVAPGLFAADASGQGLAAALVQRVKADGTQSYEPAVVRDGTGQLVPVPIDLGPEGEQVFLLLYSSGFRQRSALEKVRAVCENAILPVEYAGPQGQYVGLDQLNLRLPRSLSGRGEQNIVVTVDDQTANSVRVQIK